MGFALQIDGIPYLLGTGGVASTPTSSDADWSGDHVLLTGALEWPNVVLSERARPLSGDIDMGRADFVLNDIVPSSGIASGYNWLTYLFTRSISRISQTILTASVGVSDTDIFVESTSAFASTGTIWIDREAITYASKNATTFMGCNRTPSAYGSKASTHNVDADTSYAPFVFAAPPSIEGRRCVLYYVDPDNDARVLWIGQVNGLALSESGASWKVECDGIYTVEKELRPGILASSCRPVGFNVAGIEPQIQYEGGGLLVVQTSPVSDGSFFDTLDDAIGSVHARLVGRITDDGLNITTSMGIGRSGVYFEVDASVSQPIMAMLTVGESFEARNSTDSSDPRHARVETDNTPSVLVYLPYELETRIPVDSVTGLPTTWTPDTTTDSPHTTTLDYILVGDIDSDRRLVLHPSATTSSDSPQYVTATNRVIARDTGRDILNVRWLDHTINLRLCGRVRTSHWMRGLQRAVCVASDVLDSGVDERNWDFTHADQIVAATTQFSDREWILDGTYSIADLVASSNAFNGAALGTRNGRVSPVLMQPPLATDVVVATFTSQDYTTLCHWGRNEDGIANIAEVEGDGVLIRARDRMSAGRYGQQRTIQLKMPESDDPRLVNPNPADVVSYVGSRVLSLWNNPTFTRKLAVSLEHAFDVFIGDYVEVTDWLTPDGQGGRGPNGIIVQVIGREIDLTAGDGNKGLVLEVLGYWQGLQYGIAPCCRVTSIVGDVLSINVGYLGETSTPSDYAGSNLSDYPFLANDGGASWFAVGDKVDLWQRDVTSVTRETGFTITAVTPGAGTSTITVSPNPATVVGGNIWDVVFSDYGNGSTTSSHAKDFAWVGDYTADVIGSSTDPATRWSP